MTDDLDRLDRLAATEIMGWSNINDLWMQNVNNKWEPMYQGHSGWQPTRNIAQAWELLEKINKNFAVTRFYEKNNLSDLNIVYGAKVFLEFGHDVEYSKAETAELAIVLACLQAKGIVDGLL